MALFADRKEIALEGAVVVAAVNDRVHSASVVTSWTTHFRMSAGVTLAVVRVLWTVEGVVVASDLHRCRQVTGGEVAADVAACVSR